MLSLQNPGQQFDCVFVVFTHMKYLKITCSEQEDFDVPTRYTSMGKQTCTQLFKFIFLL